MRNSRFQPGLFVSAGVHAALLLAIVFSFASTQKFEDAEEALPVEVLSDSQFNQIMKGDKTAKDVRVVPRVDRVAEEADHKIKPPLAEAKKDTPTPPPSLRRLPDPGADETPEPPKPPKRVAEAPPTPPEKPEPPKPAPAKPEPPKPEPPKPVPEPPAKPRAAAPTPEKEEPQEAEVVKPKPPTRPKLEARDAPTAPKPERPKAEPRLKTDEVAKLLQGSKPAEAQGEKAEKDEKGVKPKSGDPSAPKTKFDAESISNLLSKEAPQRRASTGREMTHTASLGSETGHAPKMTASMEGRIAQYIKDHYEPCWKSGLSLGGESYAPIVEFHLSRDGVLQGSPKLLNRTSNPVAQARAEQALRAVQRCSPMKIPEEFMPYYDEAFHEVSIKFTDMD